RSTSKASASKKIEYKKISESAIKQTVDDMKSRDHIKDASFTVKGNKIKMKLVVDDPNLTDDKTAIKYADTYLRAISLYVDDNKPTKDSYGKIYDGYYVDIIVDDTDGMQAVEGKMYPGINSITWE
ncbi:hypothetical protein, partial [Heyndrickxia ginsengihumi]